MNAPHLLFRELFENQTLFKNQLDLAQQLLSTPGHYFIHKSPENQAEYNKALTRLKTYISQLLSDTAVRPVIPEFETSLNVLLSRKIKDTNKRDEVFKLVIQDIKLRNSQNVRQQHKLNSLQLDLSTASQVAIIAVKPFHEESNFNSDDEKSLRSIFISDVVKAVMSTENKKQYSFNFPSENYCHELWHALQNVVSSSIALVLEQRIFAEQLIKILPDGENNCKEEIKKFLSVEIEVEKQELLETIQKRLPKVILNILNKRRIVRTFHVAEPIYSVPMIAINPDQSLQCKVYIAIEEDGKKIKFFKSSQENMYIWKFFVWDKMKVSKVAKEIFAPNINFEN